MVWIDLDRLSVITVIIVDETSRRDETSTLFLCHTYRFVVHVVKYDLSVMRVAFYILSYY